MAQSTFINVVPPSHFDNKPSIGGLVSIPPQHWPQFQELIQRGANLWPDASPEIKAFADRVTNGRIMQDYYSQETQKPAPAINAINLPDAATAERYLFNPKTGETIPLPKEKAWSFATAIAEFNEMYKMPSNKYDDASQMKRRLLEFKKMLLDELAEVNLIVDKLNVVGAAAVAGEEPPISRMEIMTDLADLLGDLQVFCASEMQRFDIPLDATLRIIMDSNGSKKQADGTALYIDGKLQKGPNYWKPEPKIEEMLREYWTQV